MSTADETATPTLLSEKIRESGATLMQATPTAWRMLIESGWSGSPKLKMITCGEPLTETLAGQLLQRCESLWNLYGPTETTIYSTCTRVTTSVAPISLGSPIANTTLFILDSHQNPVPPGVPGELYIAGEGLADGYLNKPEKTSERFKMLSIHGTMTARMYQTGDRVKRLRDGTLLFLGRTDRQVKLRGFRIELGEIEHALNQLAGVQESFVVKLDHEVRGEMLAAYVLPQAGCYLDADRLRAELDNSLPEPMRPSAIRIIDRVPLSPNGKLDRKQLPDPLPAHSEIASEAPHPGVEQVLAKIWCDILQISNIGRHDNFFHLGGHSLLAARLVARIGVRFGNNLSLASLVQAPTVARLALILKGASLPSSSCIKSGRPEGKQLLWIGAEPWLPRLAKSLGNKTGLQAFTLNPDSIRTFGPEFKMQDMASHLAYRICELQPHGPYLLGGFCLNGLLAYETAQQLRLMGQHIDLLVIGDVFAPTDLQRHSTHELVRKRLQAELREFLTVLNSESREWRTYSRRRLEKFQETIERLRWQGNNRTKSIFKDLPQTLQAALYVAELRYKPGVFPGRVLFLQASEERNYRNQTTSASWKAFVRDIEVFEYLGEHSDLFEEMALRRAAEAIERAIDLGLSARCNDFAACTPNQPYPFL
jgi:thioesterase domain-containing protein